MNFFKKIFGSKHQSHLWRKEGFKKFNLSYDTLPGLKAKGLINKKKIKVELTIHIVDDHDFFEWEEAKENKYVGYASKNNISILCKIVNGKIVFNQAALGHELNHVLNFHDDMVWNPDRLDELF